MGAFSTEVGWASPVVVSRDPVAFSDCYLTHRLLSQYTLNIL